MLRKPLALGGALLALVVAPSGLAQGPPTLLMPGVTYEKSLTFSAHGPVMLHVLTMPRPGGLYALKPVLSNGAIVGLQRLTEIQAAASAQATVAGVNGDFFGADGRPTGIMLQSGALAASPFSKRSSVGIDTTGTLRVNRLAYVGNWRGTGQRRRVQLNVTTVKNAVTLYTPAYGPTTPAGAGIEAIIPSLPAATPNTDLEGRVTEVRTLGGTPIPPRGAVLVARGNQTTFLQNEAPVGQDVTIRLTLTPSWSGVTEALGGGPVLVRDGKPVFDAGESFTLQQLMPRVARTAVGQLRDGRIVLVVADGLQPGYSIGMTNFELALTLVQLGAVTGAALGSGSPSTMAFDGQLLNRVPAAGEAPLADALLVAYQGAYAAPPTEVVLSPNGDGVAESQTLAYKLVRPSSVNAQLLGPDGRAYLTDAGQRPAGVKSFPFPGAQAGAAAPLEGTWRWLVEATDDLGRRSTAERTFTLNQTLAALTVSDAIFRVGPGGGTLEISTRLARAANVVATVETQTGAILRTLTKGQLQPGTLALTWDGRDTRERLVRSAKLVVRVRATNEIGTVDLTAPFSLRRVAQ